MKFASKLTVFAASLDLLGNAGPTRLLPMDSVNFWPQSLCWWYQLQILIKHHVINIVPFIFHILRITLHFNDVLTAECRSGSSGASAPAGGKASCADKASCPAADESADSRGRWGQTARWCPDRTISGGVEWSRRRSRCWVPDGCIPGPAAITNVHSGQNRSRLRNSNTGGRGDAVISCRQRHHQCRCYIHFICHEVIVAAVMSTCLHLFTGF